MLTGRSSPVEMVAPARQATDGVIDMDNPADNLDQTDEDILAYTVSDEAPLQARTRRYVQALRFVRF